MDKKQTWLTLTAGVSDITLICNSDGSEKIYEVNKGVAKFHQWLQDNKTSISFVSTQNNNQKEKGAFSIVNAEASLERTILSAESIQLSLPKIDTILNSIGQDETIKLVGATVYYTNRQALTSCNNKENEPFFVAHLVGKYLQDKFELALLEDSDAPEMGKINLVNLLAHQCHYDGKGDEYPVAFSVTSIIERSLYQLYQLDTAKSLHIINSDMGGLPEIKRIIRASLALYFNHRYLLWTESKENSDNNEGIKPPVFSHEMSLMLRSQCVNLIKMGSVEEAWGIAKSLEENRLEIPWVLHIKYLHQLLSGTLRYPDLEKLSVEDYPYYDYLRSLNPRMIPRSLVHAFRAQAALKTHNHVVAIASTYSVDEAALFDAISIWLHKNGFDINTSIRDFTMQVNFDVRSKQWDLTLKEFFDNHKKDLLKEYKIDFRSTKYNNHITDIEDKWFDHLENDALRTNIATIRTLYRERIYLENIKLADDPTVKYLKFITCAQIRNSLAHGLPEKSIINAAPLAFGKVGVWKNTHHGYYQALFEDSPISNILASLGVSNAEQGYNSIIDGVCDALMSYDPYTITQQQKP